jgi:hypothetical protein
MGKTRAKSSANNKKNTAFSENAQSDNDFE